MLGVVLIVGATGLIAFVLFKKYRSDPSKYKTNSKDASEEVRFLTADEQLDFTIQTEDSVKKG